MGDPSGVFTKAIAMEMVHPGPYSVGIIGRCKRFAMYVVDNVVQLVRVRRSLARVSPPTASATTLHPYFHLLPTVPTPSHRCIRCTRRQVSERPDDPAGDDDPQATLAPSMIEVLLFPAPPVRWSPLTWLSAASFQAIRALDPISKIEL